MNFRLTTIQKTLGSVKPKGTGLLPKLAGALACALAFGMNAANITVPGLDEVVKGTVYAEVKADEPVTQVRMEIPGVVNRIERSAPYGLMSDRDGKLNPLDTTKHADGEYVLTVTVTLKDGSEVVDTFPFTIDNVPDEKPQIDTAPVQGIDLSSFPNEVSVGQTVTVRTGLADGAVVWYHMFDKKWGDLIRSNVEVKDGKLELKVPATSGERILQLQYKQQIKVMKHIVVSAQKPTEPDVVPIPAPEPDSDPTPDPTPTPDPEPTPDTDPAPAPDTDPEPEPVLDVMSIDMGSIPSSLTVGQKLSVNVTGIADGSVIYYHMFDRNWGDLVRSSVTVQNGKLALTVPNVNGDRILQLQYSSKYKTKKNVSVQDIVEPEPEPEPTPDPTPDPTPTAPGTAPKLDPGNGFNVETAQPANVGTLSTLPMARWDVVPMQEFRGEFGVGIIAHHSYGVDRVVMSFNGGPWKAIKAPSLNPRTGVEEYWAKIDARDIKDGKVELRAIVYPKNGKPRVMESLSLWANAGGTIDFPVHYIKPGDTSVPSNLICPKDRWLTVKYAPGASQRVSFNLRTQGNVKLEGLNIKAGIGWQGAGNGGNAWFDDCDYLGTPSSFKAPANLGDVTTLWPVDYNWGYVYYTDFVVDHVGNPLNANHGIARNVHAKTVYEDGIRVYGLVTNVVIDKIVGGNVRTPSGDYIHTDMFQLDNNMDNCIYQNIVGKDIGGQGFSHGGWRHKIVQNVAFKNIKVNVTVQNIGLRLFGPMKNVLYEDIEVSSPLGGEIANTPDTFRGEDVVLRNIEANKNFPYLPWGWQRDGIKVYPQMYD